MTGLSARNFNLRGRGEISEGAYADLVVFDAETVIDRATFDDPMQPAGGIDHVFVNGKIAWSAGGPGRERAGRFLRRQ